MEYALISQKSGEFLEFVDRDPAQMAELVKANNPKVKWLRPVVVDKLPTLKDTEKVMVGPVVVEKTQVRKTWVVSDLTPDEKASVDRTKERDVLKAAATFLDSPAPTTVAAAAQDIQKLKRAVKWLFEQAILQGRSV